MLEGGADIRYIQAMLGHARLDTTQIYTHVSILALQEVHARSHPHGRVTAPPHHQDGQAQPHQEHTPGAQNLRASHPALNGLPVAIPMTASLVQSSPAAANRIDQHRAPKPPGEQRRGPQRGQTIQQRRNRPRQPLVASMSYAYDSHGRPATTTDSRTGTTTMGSYTDSGNLLSITDPGSRTTSFTYDLMDRRLTVDIPNTLDAAANTLTNITHTSYYPTGQVKAQWGDQTNATFNVYDAQNRPLELRTYQALAHGTEPTAATGGAAITTWTYSSTRGFLTRKEYADTKGTDYTYTASGRLATRTWARGCHHLHLRCWPACPHQRKRSTEPLYPPPAGFC